MKLTNKHDLHPILFTTLAHSDYDFKPKSRQISATTLLKPIKEIVLAQQNPDLLPTMDVTDFTAAKLGSSFHAVLEKVWTEEPHFVTTVIKDYFPEYADRELLVNPTKKQIKKSDNPLVVYIEQRGFISINGWDIFMKFDVVFDGQVQDAKTTSAWKYAKGDILDYQLQMGMGKIIHPKIIKDIDHFKIHYIFKDWSAKYENTPNYPSASAISATYPHLPNQEVIDWIEDRLNLLEDTLYSGYDAQDIPCSDHDRWARQKKRLVRDGGGYETVYTRCNDWCRVRDFCKQNLEEKS